MLFKIAASLALILIILISASANAAAKATNSSSSTKQTKETVSYVFLDVKYMSIICCSSGGVVSLRYIIYISRGRESDILIVPHSHQSKHDGEILCQ